MQLGRTHKEVVRYSQVLRQFLPQDCAEAFEVQSLRVITKSVRIVFAGSEWNEILVELFGLNVKPAFSDADFTVKPCESVSRTVGSDWATSRQK